MPGIRIVPNGSTCLSGLKLTRPSRQPYRHQADERRSRAPLHERVMAKITGRAQTVAKCIRVSTTILIFSAPQGRLQTIRRVIVSELSYRALLFV